MILANGSHAESGTENVRGLKAGKKMDTWGTAGVWFLFEGLHHGISQITKSTQSCQY
jgi:hypothetical protein